MTNKRVVITSLLWKLLERCGTQGITFFVSIIIARLLDPAHYGAIAIVIVFISLANVFVQSGLNTALIQKKDADDADFSSVFYLSLVIAAALYILLYFTAPAIALFYDMPELIAVLRVLAIILFFWAFNSIQNAVVARKMQFKKLFYSSTIAAVMSGIIGVVMAYQKYGIWALVGQQISSQLFICLVMWFTVKWRPRLVFSVSKVKVLFSFGWKLLVSGLLDTLYKNISSLIIGKKYTAEMLGYYNRGSQFPNIIISNINGSIDSVLLPAYSSEQDDQARVKSMMRRAIKTSTFIVFPAMIGLAAIATPLVSVLLTDKWLPCVPFLQVYCFTYALWPIHTANLQAINAMGRSDIFLKLEIIKKSYGLIVLAITVFCFQSPLAIALGGTITGVISSFVNAQPNKKLLNYSYLEQVKDMLPALIIALCMGAAVWSINLLGFTPLLTMFFQVLVGVVIYFALAWLFKLETFTYIIATVKEYLPQRKKCS